jgi:hypothetical protein
MRLSWTGWGRKLYSEVLRLDWETEFYSYPKLSTAYTKMILIQTIYRIVGRNIYYEIRIVDEVDAPRWTYKAIDLSRLRKSDIYVE